MTNRALLLAAVASGTSTIANALVADDTLVTADAVAALGAAVRPDGDIGGWVVDGLGGPPAPSRTVRIWCGMAGTLARFLPAVCAAGRGTFAIDADPQLRGRPLQPLIAALTAQGARVGPEGATSLPIELTASGLSGGRVVVHGTATSSQFLSGLMLAAPFARRPTTFDTALSVSESYVDLTAYAMREFGVHAARHDGIIEVPTGAYRAARVTVSPDPSTTSYFLAAAAVTGSTVTLPGVHLPAWPTGDLALVGFLERMGCRVLSRNPLMLAGPDKLAGVEANMSDSSDVFMTLACVAPFASSPTSITGIRHTRYKESDRISAVAANLGAAGVRVDVGADRITIHPARPRSARLPTFRDHRIAMSFAVLGLRVPLELEDAEVVGKTCPTFFELWRNTGALVRRIP